MLRTRVNALTTARPALPLRARLAMLLAGAAAIFAVAGGGASAHHGWSGYDSNTYLVLTGVIQELAYGNPHAIITLEVPPEPEVDGTIVDPPLLVTAVLAPPFRSESRGLSQEMLQ